MEPLETSFRGGIWWSGSRGGSSPWVNFNVTWPFVVLRIEGDLLTISAFGMHRRFRPGQIFSVEVCHGFPPGVRIFHRKAIYPEYVIFWTWAPELVREALQRFVAQ